MKTYEALAEELRALGLSEMAAAAQAGMYHDFLSPYPLPEMRLVRDLAVEATRDPAKAAGIMALRKRIINGDFDASKEESDEWAASPEGQDAYRKLTERE
jgi:hypothetical protein